MGVLSSPHSALYRELSKRPVAVLWPYRNIMAYLRKHRRKNSGKNPSIFLVRPPPRKSNSAAL